MEPISFQCDTCGHKLRVPGDRAGKKGKCPKCGSTIAVPAAAPTPAPAGAYVPPPKASEQESYKLFVDPNEEAEKLRKIAEDKAKKKEKGKKKEKSKVEIRRKKLPQAAAWDKCRSGLFVLMIAAGIWGLAFALELVIYIIGVFTGPEYTVIVEEILPLRNAVVAPGDLPPFDMPNFAIALLVGKDNLDIAYVLRLIVGVLYFLQVGAFITGYVIALGVPPRFATRKILTYSIVFAGLNAVFYLFFKFLPLVGAYRYTLLPFFEPELPTFQANIDRSSNLMIFWSSAPFWEMFLGLLIWFFYYLEPTLMGVFIINVGESLKEPDLNEKGDGMLQLGMGVFFSLFVFFNMSLTGASEVMTTILRLVFGLYICFSVFLIVNYVLVMRFTYNLLGKRIEDERIRKKEAKAKGIEEKDDDEDEYEDEEEDDETDEEEEDAEDEEEDGEDEDDEEEEERRPRKRR